MNVHIYLIGGYDQEGNEIQAIDCIYGDSLHEMTPMHARTGSVKDIAHGGSKIAVSELYCVAIFRRTRLNGDRHWIIISLGEPG